MTHRFAALTATAVLGLALVGTTTAWADESPVIGTPECTSAVAADTTVKGVVAELADAQTAATKAAADLTAAQTAADAAAAALNLLGADDPGFAAAGEKVVQTGTARDQAAEAKTAADAALADAQTAVTAATGDATDALCVEAPAPTTEPTPTTTTPAPVETTLTVPPLTDDRDCRDFASPQAAQAYFLERATATQPDPDRLDANNNGIACEGSFDEGTAPVVETQINGDVIVNPTDDDDSVADTSGTQVTIVPEGSASTGEAA